MAGCPVSSFSRRKPVMKVKLMAQPPLKVMNSLIGNSIELIAQGQGRIAQGTLHAADFYLQVARHGDPPCGAEYADQMQAEIDGLKGQADDLAAKRFQEESSETA
ncbi:MAG: hypothetical protein U9Q03_06300 [Patescibacteria group bacterium]|nr:hypothetical protein [Patescibacteria group bacterium]